MSVELLSILLDSVLLCSSARRTGGESRMRDISSRVRGAGRTGRVYYSYSELFSGSLLPIRISKKLSQK